MHATYVNSDFVPCKIWQNFTAKCLAACSIPAQYIRLGCMGCRVEVVPLEGGACHVLFQGSSSTTGPHLALNSHLWLPEAVAWAAATPRATALAGRLNLVRVHRLSLKLSDESSKDCLPKHVKTGSGRLCRRNHTTGSTCMKAVPAKWGGTQVGLS